MACLLLLLLLLPACWPSSANALPPEWNEEFIHQLRLGVNAAYPYVWGGRGPNVLVFDTKAKQWAKGVDCFFYLYMSARAAAIPGIRIVTAHDMAAGRGNWDSASVPGGLQGAQPGDAIWGTFSEDRPDGHVGALLQDATTGEPGIAHASQSRRRVVWDRIKGNDPWPHTKIRRLTIGDER